MTKKDKAKQRKQEEQRKRSDMMKDEAARDINQRFREGTLWQSKAKKTKP